MQRSYEEHYHEVEATHWWFRARRQIVRALVEQVAPARDSVVLDIGCSSGFLLRELQAAGYRDIQGIDASREGIALCQQQGLRARVMDAQTPDFPEASLDVICASDVLEHLEQDGGALAQWNRMLKPGGWLIVFVPAHAWLWTQHDEVNRHFRRYTRAGLVALLTAAGFELRRSSYWNTLLFFPVAALRLWRRRQRPLARSSGSRASDMFLPPAPVNAALRAWLGLENALHRAGLNSPVGISALALARKPAAFALPEAPR
jgi:SAM-dependent methyltransferase